MKEREREPETGNENAGEKENENEREEMPTRVKVRGSPPPRKTLDSQTNGSLCHGDANKSGEEMTINEELTEELSDFEMLDATYSGVSETDYVDIVDDAVLVDSVDLSMAPPQGTPFSTRLCNLVTLTLSVTGETLCLSGYHSFVLPSTQWAY